MKYKVFAVIVSFMAVCVLCGSAFAAQVSPKKADIVFFIDSSSSMGSYIDGVRTNIANFSRSMSSSGIDVRFAIVEYHTGSNISSHMPDGQSVWTSDVSLVEKILEFIDADGGDGYTIEALNEALGWGDFRSDASRFGFMLTDVMVIDDVAATYIDYNDEAIYLSLDTFDEISEDQAVPKINSLMAETVQNLNAVNMHVSVISVPQLEKAYSNLYSSTGGKFMNLTGDYASLMLDIADYVEEVIQSDDSRPAAIPYMPLDAIPDDELSQIVTSGDITETILERIARQAHITSREINVITNSNKHLYGLAPAPEPSQEAKDAASGYEFLAKLNSLTLYSDFQQPGETGYFLAKINVSDEIAKMALTTNDVRLLGVFPEESVQASGIMQIFRSASTDPLSYWLFKDGLGIETTALQDAGYMLFIGPVADKAILYMLRIILLLLGGCNTGALAGSGIAGLFTAGGVILLRKVFRKN